MGKILIPGGSGGGIASDELTAVAGDVLKGQKYVGADTNDDIGTGTLELTGNAEVSDVISGKMFYSNNPKSKQTGTLALTGNATAAYVYSGRTFYATDPKTKLTGTLTVSSVVSFSVASVSGAKVTLRWQNPSRGPYGGVIIRVKEGGYPTSVTDGTQAYKGTGTTYALNGVSTCTWTAPNNNRTYYFCLWMYVDTSLGTLYSELARTTATIPLIQGSQTFTSSGTFTVPYGVSSIQYTIVGGGGSGGSATYNYAGHHRGSSYGGGGGGGGRVVTGVMNVTPGSKLAVVVGAGGWAHTNERGNGEPGGASQVGSIVANGGNGGLADGSRENNGGDGGSGGGAGASSVSSEGRPGGSDGANGGSNSSGVSGGIGQGTTTRAWGLSSGTLYAGGGGGGGGGGSGGSTYGGSGGDGGGGEGCEGGYDSSVSAKAGTPNTGGGGGGSGGYHSDDGGSGGPGANGGSGIVLIRWGY